MAGFQILEANHTGFTVSDLNRTVPLFRDLLGYEVVSNALGMRRKRRGPWRA
jgi:catechol 2,3-dioxygenase-like lactoylglutathione lyase family enzyme